MTGASVLSGPEVDDNLYGEPSDHMFDDLDNVADLRNIIRAYKSRRVVDNYILDLGSSGPKTAIVFPPIIFGTGKGPVNQRSIQIPSLCRAALQQRAGIYLNKGLSRWGVIHISDLAKLFVKLAEHAVNATQVPIWNENGLFFAENGFEVRPLPSTLSIDHFFTDLASKLRASRILLDSLPKKLTALAISLRPDQ